jgi:hypothetical protein
VQDDTFLRLIIGNQGEDKLEVEHDFVFGLPCVARAVTGLREYPCQCRDESFGFRNRE